MLQVIGIIVQLGVLGVLLIGTMAAVKLYRRFTELAANTGRQVARLDRIEELIAGRSEHSGKSAADGGPDPIDEGFENIMRFSVKGMTGFEGDRTE